MTFNGGHAISWKQIAAGATFFILMVDAWNGFAGVLAVQPFATKGYVESIVEKQLATSAEAIKEVNERISNLQLMSLDMSLQLLDGQLAARRGELVELRAKLIEGGVGGDGLISKRVAEVEANIAELLHRRDVLVCYRDTLSGIKRNCP